MSADFLDTNVLVYSFDSDAPAKRDRSRALIAAALQDHSATISYQVVQEFLNVATRRFASPMTGGQASGYLNAVLMPLCTVWPSRNLYLTALSVREETGFGFYDALIVAGALEASCKRLLTEDLQDGRVVRGLQIVNPFR